MDGSHLMSIQQLDKKQHHRLNIYSNGHHKILYRQRKKHSQKTGLEKKTTGKLSLITVSIYNYKRIRFFLTDVLKV